MTDAFAKTQFVNDLIGDWLEERNMFLLAKEGDLVYWESITGEACDLKWHRLTIAEASRVAKVMVVPPQYMSYCTSDSIYTAAQERGRAYLEGVRTHKPVTDNYFNYYDYEADIYNPHRETIKSALAFIAKNKANYLYPIFVDVVETAWVELGMEVISRPDRNSYVRELDHGFGFKLRQGGARYNWQGRRLNVLKRDRTKGVIESITEDEKRAWIEYIKQQHHERNNLNRR